MESGPAQRLVSQALAGHEPALVSLIDLLTPVIQVRVARALFAKRPAGENRDITPQVEDLSQEVFLTLFADGARILRTWRPERGLSLENFVGLVARRRTLSVLRTGKGSPWKEDPTLDEDLDGVTEQASPEERTASKETYRLLLRRLEEELSPLGWRLFDLFLVQERSLEEVRVETGMSRDALYSWRSRLRTRARKLLKEILPECT